MELSIEGCEDYLSRDVQPRTGGQNLQGPAVGPAGDLQPIGALEFFNRRPRCRSSNAVDIQSVTQFHKRFLRQFNRNTRPAGLRRTIGGCGDARRRTRDVSHATGDQRTNQVAGRTDCGPRLRRAARRVGQARGPHDLGFRFDDRREGLTRAIAWWRIGALVRRFNNIEWARRRHWFDAAARLRRRRRYWRFSGKERRRVARGLQEDGIDENCSAYAGEQDRDHYGS